MVELGLELLLELLEPELLVVMLVRRVILESAALHCLPPRRPPQSR